MDIYAEKQRASKEATAMIEMHQADIEKYAADAAALRTLAGASLEDTAVEGKRASIKAIDVIEMHQADIQKYEESTEMLEMIQAVNGKYEAGAV